MRIVDVKITEKTDKTEKTKIVSGDFKEIVLEVANCLSLNVTEVIIKSQPKN